MHAGGNEDAHAGVGRGGVDAAQLDGHRHARGNRARVVGANDDDVLLAGTELLERGGVVGVVEGVLDELLLGLVTLKLVLVTDERAGEVFVLEPHGLGGVVERDFHLEHGGCLLAVARDRNDGRGRAPDEPFAVRGGIATVHGRESF